MIKLTIDSLGLGRDVFIGIEEKSVETLGADYGFIVWYLLVELISGPSRQTDLTSREPRVHYCSECS